MTWLRDVLDDLAADSPEVDLAERTIRLRDRRRRTAVSVLAAATVVVIALAVTAAVRLPSAEPAPPATPEEVADLPARGVGPLSHAYKTFCRPEDGKVPPGCVDGGWRVVTRSGRTYRLAQALPALNRYRWTGLRDSPLAISSDGRKIAYYSAAAGTFAVRDLASGAEVTAPSRVPHAWLGTIAHLLLSDDGRFLAFTKNPPLKDPAMLIDLRERMVRPLPNGWNPIGLSADGATITLAQYAPKTRLRTMTHLWTTSTAGNARTADFDPPYLVGPLGPDGKTVVALENVEIPGTHCFRQGDDLVRLDAAAGEVLRRVPIKGVPMKTDRVVLRGWHSETEITALATPIRCDPAAYDDPGPSREEDRFDPPFAPVTAYAVDVRTGSARKIGSYTAQGLFEIVVPGFPGTV
ncbi:hypothetical protein HII36_17565 [Nonomuraea sp. NN258]|uniref:hypothetical protein n=1 Tax=Nonomuraea antri TaxID=2730852 RepID=UPI0015699C0E|nr:hypothetical protein [Nonomuraea antri]NRQ33644.1 hypothetical protein [Nonomuraea antri]